MTVNNAKPTTTFRSAQLLTLRVPRLIGYQNALDKIERAVGALEQQHGTTLFHVAANGGMGKTFLLQHVRDTLQKRQNLLVTPIIDFYDITVHSDIDLVDRIAQGLKAQCDEQQRGHFAAYNKAIHDFRAHQAGAVTKEDRAAIRNGFNQACADLAKTHGLVVLIDTGELLEFHQDDVQRKFGGLDFRLAASSRDWLKEALKDNDDTLLPRTLIVIASRLQPEAVFQELHDLAEIDERCVRLDGMDEAGVLTYFEALEVELGRRKQALEAEKKNNAYPEKAEEIEAEIYACEDAASKLEGLGAKARLAVHKITGGLPVSISLTTQLYLDGKLRELNVLAGKAAEDPRWAKIELRRAMVNALANYDSFGDASEPLQYLGLLRKGMTAKRLYAVWNGFDGPERHSLQDCQVVIDFLSTQTFVKELIDSDLFTGAEGESAADARMVVLHDEIADWCEEGFFIPNPKRSQEIYQRIIRHYDEEIERCEIRIEKLGTDALKARPLRRKLVTERMFYALRGNPVDGYKQYYELAEEAFTAGLPEFDAQLHAEFLQWWDRHTLDSKDYRYRRDAEDAGVTESRVNGDLAKRWVQRAFNRFEKTAKQDTKALAEKLQEGLRPTILPVDAVNLQVYRDAAWTYLNLTRDEENELRSNFDTAINKLEDAHHNAKTPLEVFLAREALAFAYYQRGFHIRKLGEYESAVEYYTKSISLYRDLNLETSHARALNDRAFAQAQIGDMDNAEISAHDALGMRQRLGHARPIGWSLNTLGYILLLSQRPTRAVIYCQEAKNLFKQLDRRRDEMLALRALAEAHRREAEALAEAPRESPNDQKSKLLEAIAAAKEAEEIARNYEVDRSDLLDILDEHGSAWRDLAAFYLSHPDACDKPDDAERCRKEAQRLLRDAADTSIDIPHLLYRHVDSLINQAFLEATFGNTTEAQRLIQEAIDSCPAELTKTEHRNYYAKRDAFWVQLAKAHSLLVRLYGEELKGVFQRSRLSQPNLIERQPISEKFVYHAVLMFYYSSKLREVRSAFRAKRTLYDQLKVLPNSELQVLYLESPRAENRLRIPRDLPDEFRLGYFILDKFGVQG